MNFISLSYISKHEIEQKAYQKEVMKKMHFE